MRPHYFEKTRPPESMRRWDAISSRWHLAPGLRAILGWGRAAIDVENGLSAGGSGGFLQVRPSGSGDRAIEVPSEF
jgi:hypothetical protein